MEKVLILNNDYTFMGISTIEKAIKLIVKGKAEIVEYSGNILHYFGGVFKIPLAIRLMKIIRAVYKREVTFSKAGIFQRDNFVCQYCGKKITKPEKPELEHVIPRSKGGATSWNNCVCSCTECNRKKADKAPSEVGMFLKKKPVQPTIAEFAQIKLKSLGLDKVLEQIFSKTF